MSTIKIMCILICILTVAGCSGKPYKVGIALWGYETLYPDSIAGFKESLAREGFTEGENIQYVTTSADFDITTHIKNIEFLLHNDVDLIYSMSAQGTLIVKATAPQTPIVFQAPFIIETSVIDSFEHSGGNLVGVQTYVPASRQYDYLKQLFPSLKKIIFLRHRNEIQSQFQIKEFTFFFERNGVNIIDSQITNSEDLLSMSEQIKSADVIYISCDPKLHQFIDAIITTADQFGKPLVSCINYVARKGGIFHIGPDYSVIGRLNGYKAARILQGEKLSNIKIEIPTNEYIIINLDAAQKLNINVPELVLENADEIIGESR